ncbi:hypothetical protein MASR2M17_14920 [Aminivibrio sp.]
MSIPPPGRKRTCPEAAPEEGVLPSGVKIRAFRMTLTIMTGTSEHPPVRSSYLSLRILPPGGGESKPFRLSWEVPPERK